MSRTGDALGGLRLALTTFTVLPLPLGRVDRGSARWAMASAPAAGALLGGYAAGLLAGLGALGAPPPLAAVLTVGGLALATRGLHLDGLADTADGLGCHAGPRRALEVMRAPEVGAFGAAALVLTLAGQAAAFAALAGHGRWLAAGLAVAAGRVAVTWGCRAGVPAARSDGLGALVAGTLPAGLPVGWTAVAALAGVPAVAGRPWQGPLAVLAAAAVAVGLTRHVTRRLSGVTGDTLGAACEAGVLAAACVLALGR